MTSKVQAKSILFLIIHAIGLAACSADIAPLPEPTPLAPYSVSILPWGGVQIQSVCLNTEIEYQNLSALEALWPPDRAVKDSLEQLGLVVMGDGDRCDATLTLTARLVPSLDTYRDDSGNTETCYLSGAISGQLKLSTSGQDELIYPINFTKSGPITVAPDECSSHREPKSFLLYELWATPLRQAFDSIWGLPGLMALCSNSPGCDQAELTNRLAADGEMETVMPMLESGLRSESEATQKSAVNWLLELSSTDKHALTVLIGGFKALSPAGQSWAAFGLSTIAETYPNDAIPALIACVEDSDLKAEVRRSCRRSLRSYAGMPPTSTDTTDWQEWWKDERARQ